MTAREEAEFKIISNSKDLPYPRLRIFGIWGAGFVLGVIAMWASTPATMFGAAILAAESFAAGGAVTCGALILLSTRKP